MQNITILWISSIQHLQNGLTIPFRFNLKFSPIISSDWGIYHNEGWILSKTNSYLFTVSSSQSANTHQVEGWHKRMNHSCSSSWFVLNQNIQCHHQLFNVSTYYTTNLRLRRFPLQNYSALSLHFWNIRRAYLQTDAIKWTTYLITIWVFLMFIRPSTLYFCTLQIMVLQWCVICNGLKWGGSYLNMVIQQLSFTTFTQAWILTSKGFDTLPYVAPSVPNVHHLPTFPFALVLFEQPHDGIVPFRTYIVDTPGHWLYSEGIQE